MLSKSYKSFQNQSTGSYQSAYCSCFSCSWHTHNKRVVLWKQHLFHCLFLRLIQTFKAEKITGKCLHFIIILARAIMFNFAICRQVVQGLYCYLRNTSLKMFCDLLRFIFSDSLNVIDILLPFSIFLFIIPIFIFKHANWIAQIASSCSEKKKHHRKKPELCFPSLMQMSSTVWLFGLGKAQAKANKQTIKEHGELLVSYWKPGFVCKYGKELLLPVFQYLLIHHSSVLAHTPSSHFLPL